MKDAEQEDIATSIVNRRDISVYKTKNWSHRVIFLYWTHHQPNKISENDIEQEDEAHMLSKNEVDQLGMNRDVRLVITNPPVVRLGTEIHKV
jgi:hypothetical protein